MRGLKPSTGRPPARWFGLVAALLAAACGPGATAAHAPPLPPCFTRYSDPQLGFEIGLPPNWNQSGRDPSSGVSFGGPVTSTSLEQGLTDAGVS